jgi:hypothetical protein
MKTMAAAIQISQCSRVIQAGTCLCPHPVDRGKRDIFGGVSGGSQRMILSADAVEKAS